MNKAVFLDRDGTLNVEVDYLHECEKLRLIDNTAEALKLLRAAGYLLIVISNQSGVGRGYFTCDDVDKINNRMNELLGVQGIQLDAFYYCPHKAEDGCTCRKPDTGLYLRAARDFDIDFACSYMVGDKEADILPALKLGAGYGLVLSGHSVAPEIIEKYKANCFANLMEFAKSIEGK